LLCTSTAVSSSTYTALVFLSRASRNADVRIEAVRTLAIRSRADGRGDVLVRSWHDRLFALLHAHVARRRVDEAGVLVVEQHDLAVRGHMLVVRAHEVERRAGDDFDRARERVLDLGVLLLLELTPCACVRCSRLAHTTRRSGR